MRTTPIPLAALALGFGAAQADASFSSQRVEIMRHLVHDVLTDVLFS